MNKYQQLRFWPHGYTRAPRAIELMKQNSTVMSTDMAAKHQKIRHSDDAAHGLGHACSSSCPCASSSARAFEFGGTFMRMPGSSFWCDDLYVCEGTSTGARLPSLLRM